MNSTAALYMMMGLLFGTTLLAIGVALGFWIAKRTAPPQSSIAPSVDPQQFMAFVRSMASWTNDFAGDVSKYRSELKSLSQQAEQTSQSGNKEDIQRLLDQIVTVNRQLQDRLDNAEKRLENQTNELQGYLTEARTDALTGLANRRAFDQRMDEQFAKCQKGNPPLALALIDIDHFKKINDTHGHPAGDAVLREVASRLRQFSDQCNLIARYGGEEFAIVFNSASDKSAAVVEKIRLAMASKPIMAEGKTVPVTISVGVSQLQPTHRISNLVRNSDEALYCAKQNGRNMVVVHNGAGFESSGRALALKSVPASVFAATEPGKVSSESAESSGTNEAMPTIDELEHRLLKRLDHLVNEEASRSE